MANSVSDLDIAIFQRRTLILIERQGCVAVWGFLICHNETIDYSNSTRRTALGNAKFVTTCFCVYIMKQLRTTPADDINLGNIIVTDLAIRKVIRVVKRVQFT